MISRRLDVELVRRGLAPSRAQAKRMIITRQVVIAGGSPARPSSVVAAETVITITEGRRQWVSRGAEKLVAALESFDVDLRGARVLDVGASTGGFTEVALESGAARVVALDVGIGQLHPRLREDPRVVSVEKANVRHVAASDLGGPFDRVLVDLSFVSLCTVAADLARLAAEGAHLIVLIKPQFEVGRSGLGHGGVVRDPERRRRAVIDALACLDGAGLGARGLIRSPITGGDGNVEYLAWLVNGARGGLIEVPS